MNAAVSSPEMEPICVHLRPILDMNDDEFFEFCQLNRELRLERTAELADGWCGIRYTPESVKPYLATLKELCQEAGRDFSQLEITAGIEPGLPLTLDTVKQFEDAGVHRLFAFSPGWMRRSRFETDLYPQMERFANEVMAKM